MRSEAPRDRAAAAARALVASVACAQRATRESTAADGCARIQVEPEVNEEDDVDEEEEDPIVVESDDEAEEA